MKVLYFMNHADQGGAALALYDLIVEMKKDSSIVPIVITGKYNRLNQMLSEINVENYSASFKNFESSKKSPVWMFKLFLKIRYTIGQYIAIHKIERVIDFSKVDIIHSNLNRIDIGAILSKKYNIPHIWHVREHADGSDFTLMSVKKNPIRYMETFKSNYIYISQSVKQVWDKKGLDDKKGKIIYDGVRTELYQPLQHEQREKIHMIFLGGYTESKGQENLIDALKEMPNDMKKRLVIDFYGNGKKKYVDYLKKKIIENNLTEVMNIYPYRQDISEKVPEYDVGLTCSRKEGFGRVTVEYMMSGLCPIASAEGATLEIVKHGKTGILYDSTNKKALCDAVIWAINNQKLIHEMGKKAEKSAKQEFSMTKHVKEIKKLYCEVLSNV